MILVIMKMLMKMAYFIPCVGLPTNQVMAYLFIAHVFWLHGLPDWVVSNQGVQFTVHFWQTLLTKLKAQVYLSLAQHPETDSGMERVNAILPNTSDVLATSNRTIGQRCWRWQSLPIATPSTPLPECPCSSQAMGSTCSSFCWLHKNPCK
ncbi:Tf2-1: Tf2-1 [Crotalus adamanteus]|uniref:Tf2-1: Tf2-1 n=1 Tax=Crotalus adamanteus TaxID=8729 RepID=A0AAW1BCM3_CROAD